MPETAHRLARVRAGATRAVARTPRVRALLELARVPATFTAAADVTAGYVVATGGLAPTAALVAAVVGSMLIYGGGVALNDWFDRRQDAIERPLRPIPSGRVAPRVAAAWGGGLLAAGVAVTALAGATAFAMAAGIAVLALLYDYQSKHSIVLGPLNMGLLRGFNFLLGVAIVADALPRLAPIALAHVAFIAGLTLVARGEATGARRTEAAAGVALAVASYAWLAALIYPYAGRIEAAPFLAAFVGVTGYGFVRVLVSPKPSRVHKAVRNGVLGLVLMEAALAAAAAGLVAGAAVALLVVPALALVKAVPVH